MSDSNTPRSAADANLLFGVLALQMDFITQDALIAAIHGWIGAKRKTLGEILVEQGTLSPENRTLLDALVCRHQQMHNNDLETSLAAATASFTIPRDLLAIEDDDLRMSLSSAATRMLNGSSHNGSALCAEETAGERYRILHPFARGGLGEVSVAEDLELHREVAVKEILPSHANNGDSRTRFLLEAEITGRLEHPGIVPVYGLGVYTDGRPFYAMRLIKGETLKKALLRFHAASDDAKKGAAERSLRFRDLLGRFVGVCNAVAYAHSRGILHRDIKPANIMLGPFGETLLVDWGLSKPVEHVERFHLADEAVLRPSSGSGIGATIVGTAIGTPGYMSPEQAEGRLEELGPASDVYSLGATLYALLTGKTPYQDSDNRSDVRFDPAELKPPRQLKPDTPRALEAICLKAMEYEPGDRYAGSLDLAAEIEHWLADEPVQAWREPITARAARWGRRHKTALAAAGVFLLSAVAALSISTALVWAEQRRTAEQKRAAEQSYALSRQLSENILKIVESSEAEIASVPALHAPRKEILKAAAQTYRQHLDRDPDDPELMTSAAQIYRYSGNVHRHANEVAAAEPLLSDSVKLAERLSDSNPDSAPSRRRLSETLRDYARLQSNTGRLREAGMTLQRAVKLGDDLHAADPNEPSNMRILGGALLNLANVEQTSGLPTFPATADRAVEIMQQLAKIPPAEKHPYDPMLLAAALNVSAVALRDAGKLDEARARHKEAIATIQPLVVERRSGIAGGDVLHFRSSFLLEQCRTLAATPTPERLKIAESNLGSVIEQWTRLAESYRLVAMYREARAVAFQARGQFRLDAKRLDDAAADLEESRKILDGMANEPVVLPSTLRELGRTYWLLGRIAQQRGQKDDETKWNSQAGLALTRALRQSPDDAGARETLKAIPTGQ